MNISKKLNLIKMLMVIVITFFLTIIIISCINEWPLDAVKYFLLGLVMKFKGLANIIEVMMPLLFTGLSVFLICRTDIFNLVSKSSFFIGDSVTAMLAVKLQLPGTLLPIACILSGGLAGMACMYAPIEIRQKSGSSEIIFSLVLNYLIFYLCSFLIRSFIKNPDSGELRLLDLSENAILFKLTPMVRIRTSLLVAIVFVIVLWLYLLKSRWGYEMRILGSSPKFVLYSGIGASASVVIARSPTGLTYGVGGTCEMLRMYSAFKWAIVPGPEYGWDGIIVAIPVRSNPVLVPVGAFSLAHAHAGADVMTKLTDVQSRIVSIIQEAVIVLVVAQSLLNSVERKAIYKETTTNVEEGGE